MWIVVFTLTGIGGVGMIVEFVSYFAILGPLTGGCANGGLAGVLMLIAGVAVLIYVAVVGLIALIGVIFFWRRSRWGPRLLIPSNLLSMAFCYWTPLSPGTHGGHADWAIILLLFGAAPAIAVGLLVWALLSRVSLPVWIAEAVVLGLIALPTVTGYTYGMGVNAESIFLPPPAPVVAAAHGCAPATAALTAP
jgi:hypothetical protein